jgi:hypothetical protein
LHHIKKISEHIEIISITFFAIVDLYARLIVDGYCFLIS